MVLSHLRFLLGEKKNMDAEVGKVTAQMKMNQESRDHALAQMTKDNFEKFIQNRISHVTAQIEDLSNQLGKPVQKTEDPALTDNQKKQIDAVLQRIAYYENMIAAYQKP